MQARTSFINFHKCTSNEKTLLDRYRSTFDKGTRSIKVMLPIKVNPFHSTCGMYSAVSGANFLIL